MKHHPFVHVLTRSAGIQSVADTPLPGPNPSPHRADLFSDHVSFRTLRDHKRMIIPHISLLFAVYTTLSLPLFPLIYEVRVFHCFCFVEEGSRLREVKNPAPGDTALLVAEVCGHPLSPLYPSLVLVPLRGRSHTHDTDKAGISESVRVSVFPSMKWTGWKSLPMPFLMRTLRTSTIFDKKRCKAVSS